MISITPEGVVLKDGEELGRIDGDTMTHHAPVGGVVKGRIRKEAGNPNLQFVAQLVEAPKKVEFPEPFVAVTLDQLQAQAAALGLTITPHAPFAPIPSPAAIVKTDDIVQPGRPPRPALEWILERASKGEIPTPPPMGPEGDKTPAFIRWFKQHATPEEFEIQYGGRKYSLDPTPKQSTKLPGEFYES